MATIDRQRAVGQLVEAVKDAHSDDLAEIYNELFPYEPTTEREAAKDPSAFVAKIIAHIGGGLEVEEILDLWNVVFPAQHRAWFEEDGELIHYEKSEPVGHRD